MLGEPLVCVQLGHPVWELGGEMMYYLPRECWYSGSTWVLRKSSGLLWEAKYFP